MSVDSNVPTCSGQYHGRNLSLEEDVAAGAPSMRLGSLARCLPVGPDAVNSDSPGVECCFARSTRDSLHSAGIRTAVAVGWLPEQETRAIVVEDRGLRKRWEVAAAAHGRPRVVFVLDLCHRGVEDSKSSSWAKGEHKYPQGPAEAAEQKLAVRHQGVVVLRVLQAVLLGFRPAPVVARRLRIKAYREEHRLEQRKQVQMR